MVRRIAVGGMVAALAVALTYARASLPNLELTSLTIFLGGWVLGTRAGALTGTVAALALSLPNPMGPPTPPLLAAQCAGYALWGAAGGLAGRPGRALPRWLWAALALGLTLVFQVLVNLSLLVGSGLSCAEVLVPAVPYALTHMGWNLVAFGLLGPSLQAHVIRLRGQVGADG